MRKVIFVSCALLSITRYINLGHVGYKVVARDRDVKERCINIFEKTGMDFCNTAQMQIFESFQFSYQINVLSWICHKDTDFKIKTFEPKDFRTRRSLLQAQYMLCGIYCILGLPFLFLEFLYSLFQRTDLFGAFRELSLQSFDLNATSFRQNDKSQDKINPPTFALLW